MKDSFQQFNLKHPSETDVNLVFNFMNACDISEYGEADSDLDELSDQWQEVPLDENVWISLDDVGDINGYALLSEQVEESRFLDLYTHRVNSPSGLEETLIDLTLNRFKALLDEGESTPDCDLTTFASGINTKNRAALESRGFQIQKFHYRMQLDFTSPLQVPDWPAEFSISSFVPGEEKELYDLIASTFDWQGVQLGSFETWCKQVFRGGRYDPDLFMMVRQAGDLVGAAICYDEETRGWVKEIAVSKKMQGKGLGSLLLQHVFSVFQNNGLPTVALAVASANEKAYAFYERCGMTRTREFVQYHLRLSA